MSDPTPEQVKLREEAEKYHQQQLQREQQQETVEEQPQQPKVQQEQGQVCVLFLDLLQYKINQNLCTVS